MKRDRWDTHMRAGAHQLHNIDQLPVYLPLKHGDKRDKNETDGGRERNLEMENVQKDGPRTL